MRRGLIPGAAVLVTLWGGVFFAQKTPHHVFDVTARRHAFEPARLEVHVGDLVKITLHAEDIPHSFVVDEYRIAKKAVPGKSVTFEFLADRVGRFVFYCNLTVDDDCRHMRGELVVAPDTAMVSGKG